ncbi:MAG: acetoacetate--CoA ligase [Acidobacteriota bacterium]
MKERPHIEALLAEAGVSRYEELHAWSVERSEEFWRAVRRYAELPEGEFNFAEVLLRRAGEGVALVYRDESGARREWSGVELRRRVAGWSRWMRARGVGRGDRIVAVATNSPEAVGLMLAAVSLGAVWSSCSPDFGEGGITDRFAQLEPKLVFAVREYGFAGKHYRLEEKMAGVMRRLGPGAELHWIEELPEGEEGGIDYVRQSGEAPLFILFSSGTTGLPKCIVHSSGGTLAQIVKEHLFHVDLREGEKLFYYTTCGWMMWNWLVVGLASGAGLVLYHGSPFYPDAGVLWRLVEEEGVEHCGLSAKYLALLEKSGYRPGERHELGRLRQVLSTGSPLLEESFDYVWGAVKEEVHLASISGGTDIVSCFVLGHWLGRVRRGEIMGPGLGMDVQVWNEAGERVWDEPGELVCVNRFPSQPLGFWGDGDGSRYRKAYFERYGGGVWHHGDWAKQVSESGGFVIYGRSDTTLNPGGIRIGTAEIYRQVEVIEEVEESVVVGQAWGGDERIVLFVKTREGVELSEELREKIRRLLREQASPHHVPKKILGVGEIPRTVSGKISEAAVREAVAGRVIGNLGALANPESIKEFQGRRELLED